MAPLHHWHTSELSNGRLSSVSRGITMVSCFDRVGKYVVCFGPSYRQNSLTSPLSVYSVE